MNKKGVESDERNGNIMEGGIDMLNYWDFVDKAKNIYLATACLSEMC